VSSRLHQTLADRYVLERELGAGGMATVFLARDLRHESMVAVKMLHGELAPLFAGERFAREIRITAGLQHPHILPVLDSGVADGVPYYTMPVVEGETLAHRLERERQLPLDDTLRIAGQLADALAYAHSRGVVHRDIKPSNVLLAGYPPTPGATSTWYAMLADFGIARAMHSTSEERITESGIAVGTVLYMSPEQGAGERVDGRSDIYALGCVVYEMLAGSAPFTGPSAQAIIARHAVDAPPSLRTVRATVSPALEAVVFRAMAKAPADRFQDAASFREALTEAARATTASTVALPATRSRRGPWIAVAAIAAVAAGAYAWQTLGTPRVANDPNRLMVFPLDVSGGALGRTTLGEDVATMVGNALDGVGPLRWVDGWRLMTPAQRQSGAAPDLVTGRALARAQHCGRLLLGKVTPLGGDSVSVTLELYDEDDDRPVRGQATGLRADAWRLGLHAVNQVVPTLVPGSRTVDPTWINRPPAAIASFLFAEEAAHRHRLGEALGHYRDAIAKDSTFAAAAMRGAQAASWNHRVGEASAFVELALRQPLSERDRRFALGEAAFLRGAADTAAADLQRALAVDPEMAVAWMQLGEVYTHLLPATGDVDSLAADALERAHALDSAATGPLLHLIERYLRRGQVDRATPLAAQFLASTPDTLITQHVSLLMTCARDGASKVDWSREATTHPLAVLSMAGAIGIERGYDCAKAGYAAVLNGYPRSAPNADNYRWPALVGLQAMLLARGDVAGAGARIDSAIAAGLGGSTLFLLDATVAPALTERARAIAAGEATQSGSSYAGTVSAFRLWHLGTWDVDMGHVDLADSVARRLWTIAAATHDQRDSVFAQGLSARVMLARAATRADSSAAIIGLSAVLAMPVREDDLNWDLASPRAGERLLLARALAARSEPRRAIAVAEVFESRWPLVHTLYLPASLQVRLAAARSLGDDGSVARYQARIDSLKGGLHSAAR
jgi:tetratricopeptide (TPR) repeat protein